MCERASELWAVVKCVSLQEPPPAQPVFLGERDSSGMAGFHEIVPAVFDHPQAFWRTNGGMAREEMAVSVKK